MHYAVRARLIADNAVQFLCKLTDGTIAGQEPDGKEIVASMQRAVIDDEGVVRWSEVCYCPTPLAHERETVYDLHFTEIETEAVEGYVSFDGEPLISFLRDNFQA